MLTNNRSDTCFQWFGSVIIEVNGVLLRSIAADVSELKTHPDLNAHEILNSTAWYRFEKGLITEEACIHEIGKAFDLPENVAQSIVRTGMPTEPIDSMLKLVDELRWNHKLFAAGNLPRPASQPLFFEQTFRRCFEYIFASSEMGERLPHLGFFERVLTYKAINPSRTLYVGANLDNVVAARSYGFYGILATDLQETVARIRMMCINPIPRAQEYLRNNARQLHLEMPSGKLLTDAFAQFLILDATEDESLVEFDDTQKEYAWAYGKVPKMFQYPPDIDTNAIGMSAIKTISDRTRNEMMDKMLRYRDSTGILQTYLCDERTRVCATAALNTIAFFNEFGRGHQVRETEDWILRILKARAFGDGTRYYPTCDFFLYFCSRLIKRAPHLRRRFEPVLKECMLERTEAPGDALSLACRVIASARCGIKSRVDFEHLLALQEADGSFGAGLCYRFARGGLDFRHRGLTTALSILAVREWDQLRAAQEQENMR